MNRYLEFDLSRAEGNTIPAVLSTDTPVRRHGYMEVLDHTPEAINIRTGDHLPLLTAHNSSETAQIIGPIRAR